MGASSIRSLPPFFWSVGEGSSSHGLSVDGTVVGHDEGTWIVVTPDGRVQSVLEGGGRRFVNSSLHAFASSLSLLETTWSARAADDDIRAAEGVRIVRAGLERIDAASLEDRNSWWALILEQMAEDFL